MTSTEKKCCEKCFGTGRYGENGEGICPDMVHVSASEKPVQEKLLSGHRGVSHAESIAPVGEDENEIIHEGMERLYGSGGEAWEKEFAKVEAKFLSDIKNGREDGLYVLDTSLFKSLFSKLLQAEREKEINIDITPFLEKGAQAERQRIEDAVEAMFLTFNMPSKYGDRKQDGIWNVALAAVLKVIRGEDIKS